MLSSSASPARAKLFVAVATLCTSFVALAIIACNGSSTTATAPPPATITCAAAGNINNAKNPAAPTVIDATCAQLPFTPAVQASGEGKGKPVTNQQAADMYSWLSFLAVNWPASASTCAPDTAKTILNTPGNPTWLTWLSPPQIFKKSGAPDPWCGGPAANGSLTATQQTRLLALPVAVRKIAQAHPEVSLYLSHSSKSEDLTSAVPMLAATAGKTSELDEILQSTDRPIVDQNGRFARYSVVVGYDEYNFIKTNNLFTKAGQTSHGPATFPSSDPASGNQGGLELKAAWKVIGPGDNPANFFTQQAIVYNDQCGQPGKPCSGGELVTVGLISLHIIHKAQGQAVWTWATFEQESNTTSSFYNPHCVPPAGRLGNDCLINQPTAGPNAQELGPNGKPLQFPTQIQPKPYSTVTGDDYNPAFQKLLAGTPWAHYKLVSTQWLSGATGLVPAFMASTVQETFVPKLTSSGQTLDGCGSCHRFANDAVKQPADFSFLLSHAQQ
jgi:hypothetical protein